MNDELLQLIDEAVELEMNIGKLYSLFSRRCSEDREFWSQLELEEYNHAALLKAAKEFVAYSKFPLELIPKTTEQINQSINQIEISYQRFEEDPDRFTAFSMAYELENSAGELHYQKFMKSGNTDNLTQTFQQLNRADNDHSKRVLDYWTKATQESSQA